MNSCSSNLCLSRVYCSSLDRASSLSVGHHTVTIRGGDTDMWVLVCPHGFQFIFTSFNMSFSPLHVNFSPAGTAEIQRWQAHHQMHRPSINLFTYTHNCIHSILISYFISLIVMICFPTSTQTDTGVFFLLHVEVKDILSPSTLRSFSENNWIPYLCIYRSKF